MTECAQCTARATDYCIDCDDDLCSDCCAYDHECDEVVCEKCLTDREERRGDDKS